jgi:hypothetical protein
MNVHIRLTVYVCHFLEKSHHPHLPKGGKGGFWGYL